MKLYEEELRTILDECVTWGKKNKWDNSVNTSIASHGRVINMKSNSVVSLPKQVIIDCVGYSTQDVMYMIMKMCKEISFVIYMRNLIIDRCNRHIKFYNSPDYSLIIENFHIEDYMDKFKLTKSTAYNYICRCEKMGFIYDEGNGRYSLSFIFNPFSRIEEVVRQNESFAIQYYSTTLEGELFVNKKYGSFDKSPWSRHVMIGAEIYTMSKKSSSIPTMILIWLDKKIKENKRDSYYIDYNGIASAYSEKYSRVSSSKIRKVVNVMESDGIIIRSKELDKKRTCYSINYSMLKK